MLRRLEYFVTAAEMGSFTKAAEKLFVTQPALSKGIIHLEKELGAPLFVRGSRQVLLTRAGTVCLKQARELLRQAEVLREAVAFESEQLRGALNIGYLIYGHLNAIGPDIYGFTQLHPQVTVNTQYESHPDAQKKLLKGELDCYFVSRTEVNDVEGAEFAVAHPSQLVVIVPRNNDLWSRESLTLSQLKEENFIMWDLRTVPSLTAAYIQACRNAGFEPNVIGYGTKMADVTTMALMYGAVALTDATAGYIENDQQRIIPLRNAPAGFDIAVVKLRENKNKLACRFVEYFRTLYGPHEQKE